MNGNANFKTLGLQADASWDEVKLAFRRLARTYHPDVAGPEGARKFAEITEAYMTLKESISPGAVRHSTPRPAEERTETKRESFLCVLWRKLRALFCRKEQEPAAENAYEYDIPPARVRFIGSILSRAESEIHDLMSRRGEFKSKSETEAMLRRISSRHPGVALLALKRISMRDASDELRQAIVDHFRKHAPESEVLERLLALFSNTPHAGAFAKALAVHSSRFSEGDALLLLKWYKRHKEVPKECYTGMLSHESRAVIAAALGAWSPASGIVDVPEAVSLLKRDEEEILVPLLRMLKREKLPIWILNTVSKISNTHDSSVVRVWASAIVRERNLG